MAVVGTPIVVSDPGAQLGIPSFAVPEDAAHEGCPIRTRQRHVRISKGQLIKIEWQLRLEDGSPADISDFVDPYDVVDSQVPVSPVPEKLTHDAVRVRFSSCDELDKIYEVKAYSPQPCTGLVRFNIPKQVRREAGIYVMQLGLIDKKELIFAERGLLSVERSLWGDTIRQRTGPPTLSEIRLHLRDTQVENDFLMHYEFDADEIIQAVIRPIQIWNETPPPIAYHTTRTFPFRSAWMDGIVAELMTTAAYHYLRNKTQMEHGGVRVDDRNKDREYMQIANMKLAQFREFVVAKKVQINASMFTGRLGSSYR